MAGKNENGGVLGAIKEAVSETLETIRSNPVAQVAGKVWDGMQPAFEHGAHEAAAALFRGDAFVMYPRTKEGNEQETMASINSAAQDMAKAQEKEAEMGKDGPDRGMEM